MDILQITMKCFGLVSNMLSFTVVIQKSLRKLPTSRLMLGLAVADTLTLVHQLTQIEVSTHNISASVHHTHEDKDENESVHRLRCWFVQTFQLSSHLLIVYICSGRLVAISCLTKAKQINSLKVTNIIIGLIYVISAIFAALWTNLIDTDAEHCVSLNNHHFAPLSVYVPVPLVLIINTISIIKLLKIKGSSHVQIQDNYGHATIMLVAVSMQFTICTMPIFVHSIMVHLHEEEATWADKFGNVLITCNYSFNFFIYVLVGRKFRQELVRMFCKRNTVDPNLLQVPATHISINNRGSKYCRGVSNKRKGEEPSTLQQQAAIPDRSTKIFSLTPSWPTDEEQETANR